MTYQMNLRKYTLMGILVAMEIVLSRFLSIQTWNLKISLSFVPIVAAAMLFGAMEAGTVAVIADIIGALLFPTGVYFPGFTVTAFLTGFLFGAFLEKKTSFIRVIMVVLLTQIAISLFLNTLWIAVLYQVEYWPLFITRIKQTVVMIAVQTAVIWALSKKGLVVLKRVIE